MTDQTRRIVWAALIAVPLVIIVAGLWPTSTPPQTNAERTSAIASVIRCPFCNGESVAEATSQVARDLETVIAEQVDAGRTDEEIYAYFADRYGESILVSPPLAGWGWGLWALPLVALLAGGVIVWRKRRRSTDGHDRVPATGQDPDRLEAAAAQIDRDLQEARAQFDAGEIDAAAFAQLTDTYEGERAAVEVALATDAAEGAAAAEARPTRRLVGAAILIVGAVALSVFVIASADRSDSDATAGIVDAPPIDPSAITVEQLEAAVEANPEIVGMRLALAKTLMTNGDMSGAARQFGQVLERERHPEALAWVGWILHLSDEPESASNFLEEALELEPNYPQAQWWLANVRFEGLGDPAGAIAPLEQLLSHTDVPDDIRAAAVQLLAEARAS